jgi:type I restriction enzyme M protein
LRDLRVRGKYRDVILPVTMLRRLDVVLEQTKKSVLDMKAALDKAGITNQDQALGQAAGQHRLNESFRRSMTHAVFGLTYFEDRVA